MKKFLVFALSLLVVLGSLQPSCADVVVSNLGEPTTTNYGWHLSSIQWDAMSFTVGTNAPAWSLDSVDMPLWASIQGGDFAVEIHLDSGGLPGALLVALNGFEPSVGAETNYNYLPNSATLLLAGATYWLTTSTVLGSYGWISTDPQSGNDTGVNGWSIGDNVGYSTDLGTSWFTQDNEPGLFAINATPVPEPSTMALFGMAAISLLIRRRA